MTSLVALLVVGSAAMHASWNVLIKGRKGDPLAASAGLSIVWVIGGAPLLFFVEAPPAAAWPYLLASQVSHLGYFSLLIMGYRRGDLSLVYPIARGVPPLLVTAGAWAIAGEQPTPWVGAGVVCIALGVAAVAGGKFQRRSIQLALATAVFIAGYTILDGLGVREAGDFVSYVVWLTTIQGALFAAGAVVVGGRPLVREAWERRGTALATGTLSVAGYAVALWAMQQAPLGSVAALRETAVIFAAILGALVLKEPFGSRRIAAATIVAAGAMMIRVG